MKNNILIVGAGFAGSTIARLLAEKNYKVDIIDKRNHLAGNAFDYEHETGIRVHRYGPHFFHTNNNKVIDFLSQYTDWVDYKHRAKSLIAKNTYVTFPPNKETLKKLGKVKIEEILYKPYSEKMWGVSFSNISDSVLKRVKINERKDDFYFPKDKFQKLPKLGYNSLFESMLKHDNIKVHLSEKFNKDFEPDYIAVFNSMSIDEYYDFFLGKLQYRSVKFENKMLSEASGFPVAQVNFTDDKLFTRAIDWSFLPGNHSYKDKPLLTYEKPCDFEENNMERYYPVRDIEGKNMDLYKKYYSIKNNKTTFIGRCGRYVYLDMDQVVANSIKIARDFLQKSI